MKNLIAKFLAGSNNVNSIVKYYVRHPMCVLVLNENERIALNVILETAKK